MSNNSETAELTDYSLEHSLGFLVNSLARLMRIELESRLKSVNLTPTTWTIMMALGEADCLSQTDLARRTFLDGATMTRALDLLETKKYITRKRDDSDRRIQNVKLTIPGRNSLVDLAQIGLDVNDDTTAILKPSERDNLEDLLSRLLNSNLNRSENGADSGK